MTEAIYRQQLMTMNGKNGAVCAFIYHLIPLFGRQVKKGVFIDLQITNDDIANFCGGIHKKQCQSYLAWVKRRKRYYDGIS